MDVVPAKMMLIYALHVWITSFLMKQKISASTVQKIAVFAQMKTLVLNATTVHSWIKMESVSHPVMLTTTATQPIRHATNVTIPVSPVTLQTISTVLKISMMMLEKLLQRPLPCPQHPMVWLLLQLPIQLQVQALLVSLSWQNSCCTSDTWTSNSHPSSTFSSRTMTIAPSVLVFRSLVLFLKLLPNKRSLIILRNMACIQASSLIIGELSALCLLCWASHCFLHFWFLLQRELKARDGPMSPIDFR